MTCRPSVDSAPLPDCWVSVPPPPFFNSSFFSAIFSGGPAGNQWREKVIEVLKRNCLGEEKAGSKGEQLRSDVIQLCSEEFSINIMINSLIIRSLRRQIVPQEAVVGTPLLGHF